MRSDEKRRSKAPIEPLLEIEPKEESRYLVVTSIWDASKAEFVDNSHTIKDEKPTETKEEPNRAFTFRKTTFNSSLRRMPYGSYTSSEVIIHYPALQVLLGRLTAKWGWGDKVNKCVSPYTALVYSWTDAESFANNPEGGADLEEQQARKDLRELLKMIATSSGDLHLGKYFKDRPTLLEDEAITHSALWTLFPPGTLVIGRPCHEETQVFFVDSCYGFVEEDEKFVVVCYAYDWNGTVFKRVPYSIEIPGWGGERKSIVELPVYPLVFHREGELDSIDSISRLKDRLIKRGRRFVRLCTATRGKQMFKYSEGPAYFARSTEPMQKRSDNSDLSSDLQSSTSISSGEYEGPGGSYGSGWKRVSGGMIVDFSSYLAYQSPGEPILGSLAVYKGGVVEPTPERSKPIFRNMYRFDWDNQDLHKRNRHVDNEKLLCCPPRVLGYSLKLKTWVQLLVKHVQEPDSLNAETFNSKLQLDQDAKDLIFNTVTAHERGKQQKDGKSVGLDDFAPEKGRGLVIMLYGAPGVGKTLTAESVADMTGKPLLSVGVSDIGIDGDKVEMNLQKVFALAGLWEAVLLFDEADVFLEARGEGDNDLRRNAMVSVLLRVLEYYEGILILTTNRMRSLDIAVQSRIHLAVKFVDLQPDQKVSIYESFFEQLANKGKVDDLEALRRWATKYGKKFDFNGRQIRNVISTAMSIALAEEVKLKTEHLSIVSRQTDDFKRDLSVQEGIYKDKQIRY
ncbi:unnamed protein product [Periconia digitata]|uniref:AAA+ ATPase domain-containing protein n=1 Tax=Periconia digitata TaxID=1303443 RepID=A0A9W4UHS2_9PLEO|nr:unnamed protein product [Periconia digitata]